MVSGEDRGREGTQTVGLSSDRYIGRSITKIGNSKGVTLPSNWCERLDVDIDGVADLEVDFEDGTVTLDFRQR